MKTLSSSVAFQDEAGNALANGSLVLTLPYGVYEIAAGGGQVVGQSLIINLDATGKVPGTPQIWASDELSPQTPYTVSICSAKNGLGEIASATWLIAGSSPIDLSQMVSTAAAPFSLPGVVMLAPAGNQTIVQPVGTSLTVNRLNANFDGTPWADVKAFGALGDGVTDDTAAIQAAMSASHYVFFPDGTYMINAVSGTTGGGNGGGAGGVAPQSNSIVFIGPNATLKAITNNVTDYNVLRLKDVSNVLVTGGGTISGERSTHTGVGGEWGYCIGIWGGSNIRIEHITTNNAWGDGIFLDKSRQGLGVIPLKISIFDVISDNNRRQGMSVICVNNLRVLKSIFQNTNGTAPQAGVDIEPGVIGNSAIDVEFVECSFLNNVGAGLDISGGGGVIQDVRVIGGKSDGNCTGSVTGSDNAGIAGVVVFNANGTNNVGGVEIAGMTVSNNGPKANGIYLLFLAANSANIHNNTLYGNGDATDSQMVIQQTLGISVHDNMITSLPGVSPVAIRSVNDNSNTNLKFYNNWLVNGGTGTLWSPSGATTPQYFGNYDGTSQQSRGLIWIPSIDQTKPSIAPAGPITGGLANEQYVYALSAAADGSMVIGIARTDNFAYADVIGGSFISGVGAHAVSGVRLMRGTVAGGYENLLVLDDTAKFLKTATPQSAGAADLGTAALPWGTAFVKRFKAEGSALVAGDFALSAGFGTTATVTAVLGTDQAWTITVTSSGTGQAANPTITLTFHDGTWTNSPISVSKMSGGTGAVTQLTEAPTATTLVLTFQGTPVAGSTYVISSIAMGR